MLDSQQAYTGWKKWKPNVDEWVEFSTDKVIPFNLFENEYLLIYNDEDKLTEQYVMKSGKLVKIGRSSIKVGHELEKEQLVDENTDKKKKTKYSKGKNLVITPRNDEQVCCIDLLKDDTTTIKTILGVWGSGKDFLMANVALELLSHGKYEKIIWLRNNIRTKDTPDLGALPGEVEDKLIGYVGPFIDAIGEGSVRTLLNKGTLKIEPLQSIRGRNFANSIIICSEAENLTYDHLKLIVARVAEGSCLFINGDIRQRDMNVFEKSRGLEKFIECLRGEELFGYVYLPKTERSATARLADKLDNFSD